MNNPQIEQSGFHIPQRQSPKAIVLILFRYLRVMARQIWPILLVVLINPSGDKGKYITMAVIAITVLSLIYSLIAYSRYYFFIEDNKLCVRSGVFRKTIVNIPFDRIQSVDFKQNIIHQLLHVASVQIDTAGTKGSELEIDAMDIKRGGELRDIILAFKKQKADHQLIAGEALATEEVQATPELIVSLSPMDLIKIGISENHLRTAAIIFAFFIGIAEDIDQILGWDIYGQIEDTTSAMSIVGILATLVAIPLFIIISFIITLFRTILKYYDLKFWREGFRFKVVSGLLTRNEKTIQQSKIQVIRWMTSPIKRVFGIFQMNIYQAANQDQEKDRSLVIPGCYEEQVHHTLDVAVPGFREAVLTSHRMNVRIVILMVGFFGFLPAVLFGLMAWYNDGVIQWLLTLVFPLAIWMGYLYQKKRRCKIHPDFLLSEGGIFGHTYKLIEIYKIQSVQISASPLQRRRGLSTLHVYTAGGDITFPYLQMSTALQARDYLLYRVEKEQKSWM